MHRTRLALSLFAGALMAGCFIEDVRVGDEDTQGSGGSGGKNGSGGAAGTGGAMGKGGAGGGAQECTTNRECVERSLSTTAVCREDAGGSRCVDLLSAECPKVLADPGDVLSDDALVLGVLGAPSAAPALAQAEQSFELARHDFVNVAGGLVSGGAPRPVIWVSCDVGTDSDSSGEQLAVAEHLLDELRVPAVVLSGPASWGPALAARAAARGAVAFDVAGAELDVPSATFFSNGLRAIDEVRAEAAFVAESEAKARAGGETGELKLAFFYSGASETSVFGAEVRFNGKGSIENGANYRALSYGDVAAPDFEAKLAAAVAAAAAFGPHLVACTGPACGDVLAQLETVRPGVSHYVLPASAAERARTAVADGGSLRTRVLGSLPGRSRDDVKLRTFALRLAALFPGSTPLQGLAASAYDAAYALMFGLAAAGTPPQGDGLRQALRNNFGPGGLAVEALPGSIQAANAVLADRGSIYLQGAMGDVYFDEQGGVTAYEAQAWCVPADSTAQGVAETGLRYVKGVGLQGANGCF
jgi:hypothetical protein